MSVLISAVGLAKAFGARTLFKELTFSIESGQKIGLIGPNGAGKSTLLKMLSRRESPDGGQIHFAQGLRFGFLEQEPAFGNDETVFTAIAGPAGDHAENIGLVHEMISRLELDSPAAGFDRLVRELSGGWKKRVALARELVKEPDLLLLDEPTNHLDVESILWLEDFLSRQRDLGLLTVTHDRLFLQNTCEHIFDLDPRHAGGLLAFKGSYADFLDVKEQHLSAQEKLEDVKRNTLRRETEWLRRGAKARQTKQKARIERAHELKDEVGELEVRNRSKRVDLDFGDTIRNPKKIIEAKEVTKAYEGQTLFKNFTFTLGARSRVGLLGPNGCGKSTLIKTLLGQVAPDAGTVFVSDQVKFAYFEQGKETLTPGASVLKSVAPEGDYVHVRGQPVFARSYLSRFLFRPEQMDQPVERLSGGERSRLRLAQLMLLSEAVLVLDEPTNDLDIPTLDVLEGALADFGGALIIVTHDRYFMDRVVNEVLAFTGHDGELLKFADVLQWQAWFESPAAKKKELAAAATSLTSAKASAGPAASPAPAPVASGEPSKKIKLSYKEQREYDTMEETILVEEEKLSAFQKELDQAGHSADYGSLQELSRQLEEQRQKVDNLYARWQVLGDKINGASR